MLREKLVGDARPAPSPLNGFAKTPLRPFSSRRPTERNVSMTRLLPLCASLLLAACAAAPHTPTATERPAAPQNLDFSKRSGSPKSFELDGQTVHYRAFEGIVYVANPVDKDYQVMNVYIPEAYFNNETVNGFSRSSAPIFFPNAVGGYMPAKPETPSLNKRAGNAPNAVMVALSKGFVVASAGARGRTLQNADGRYTGKAPAAIVDLKAAVRYLKANDAAMAGDAEKIIANGTSAGGALSALLGASGDSPDYEPYLNEIGALKASDRIFAVSAYCPITNLEHADAAYEWQFNGVNDYQKISVQMLDYNVERKLVKGTQTAEQAALSDKLKPLFPAYVNSLKLKDGQGLLMELDTNGNGTFRQHIESLLVQSAQKALDGGADLSAQSWLKTAGGKVLGADFAAYARFVGRQKTAPAFDGVDLSSGENNLFGNQTTDKRHFTDFGMANSTVSGSLKADAATVRLMNAMHYIAPNTGAAHYRIRHGTNDRDTSLAIPALLALKIADTPGKTVDFALSWGQGHGGDYDLDELFDWMRQISK